MDYGKYKYEQQKKEAEARKKQKTIDVKEIKFRPNTDIHDYEVKMRSVTKFLDHGDKVKITMRFRGREMAHQELGKDLLERVAEDTADIGKIDSIPNEIKQRYKIVWDMSMKRLIDMAKDRGAFICQSQSMNLWVEDPNYKNLTSMHFYAWRSGLKTGIYYLRRKAKHQAQQFTIEPTKNIDKQEENHEDEVCEMCSG